MKKALKRILAFTTLLALAVVSRTNQALAQYQIDAAPLPHTTADQSKISAVLTIVFAIVGILSVMMVTIGGFKYITSQGDSQAVAKAKNTIIYAIIGVLVSILSIAIVTFVIGKL